MDDRKTIAIVGATGAQGGGLVRAILDEPGSGFHPRALTRDPDAPKARELGRLGAEVVAADLDDAASLTRAFRGAHGAYCVTNFWEHFSPERELSQATNLAEAAQEAGLQHVIWSTLEDTRRWVPLEDQRMPTLQGRYKVPHFDAKGEADHLFTERGVPTTFLLTSFYWDNFIGFGLGPKRGADGVLALVLPMGDKKLPGIAAEDTGRCAYGIFNAGPDLAGQRIGIAGGHLTGEEMAQALGRALGEEVRYTAVSPETFRGLGFPGADDLGNMFQFKRDFNDDYCRVRDLAGARRLNPALQDFETWLARHGNQIPKS
ncbi:NmrA/HSCARG family protein [Microvirga massiliensis]|uniref:NmrA/HSCARG family protein n=1 Tax=Microvirga massiliensis TaxID=1033741 RepID=UPI00062BB20D|nr:NmrA/HSCARG family protein [Microvirga massiliensis]